MKRTMGTAVIAGVALACLVAAEVGQADEIPEANPLSGNEKSIKSGRSWYQNLCGTCHGATANGSGERGQGADLRKLKIGFRGFVETVKNGRTVPGKGLAMPPWGGAIDDKTIYEIGAFLETLALAEANWKESVAK